MKAIVLYIVIPCYNEEGSSPGNSKTVIGENEVNIPASVSLSKSGQAVQRAPE